MIECESIARKWGSSIGITVPKDIVEKENIKPNTKIRFLIVDRGENPLRKYFGIGKHIKKPTQKIVDELRKDAWRY